MFETTLTAGVCQYRTFSRPLCVQKTSISTKVTPWVLSKGSTAVTSAAVQSGSKYEYRACSTRGEGQHVLELHGEARARSLDLVANRLDRREREAGLGPVVVPADCHLDDPDDGALRLALHEERVEGGIL